MATEVEASLYRSASTFEEYNDDSTLRQRMQDLAISICGRNQQNSTTAVGRSSSAAPRRQDIPPIIHQDTAAPRQAAPSSTVAAPPHYIQLVSQPTVQQQSAANNGNSNNSAAQPPPFLSAYLATLASNQQQAAAAAAVGLPLGAAPSSTSSAAPRRNQHPRCPRCGHQGSRGASWIHLKRCVKCLCPMNGKWRDNDQTTTFHSNHSFHDPQFMRKARLLLHNNVVINMDSIINGEGELFSRMNQRLNREDTMKIY